jgi:hypothetical protein
MRKKPRIKNFVGVVPRISVTWKGDEKAKEGEDRLGKLDREGQ